MFPAFCYRREAHWRHRLAVAVGMWPRGEVGAGVLVLSVSYGIGGPVVTVAMLSLALNLALTGIFILIVKQLIDGVPEGAPMAVHRPAVDHLTRAPSGTVSRGPRMFVGHSGKPNTKMLLPLLGRSSGVRRMLSRELSDDPVLATTYCFPSTA